MNTTTEEVPDSPRTCYRITVSHHAYRRARERLHWDSRTTLRMTERALHRGHTPGTATGALKYELLRKVSLDDKASPFLYGEYIYIIAYSPTHHEFCLQTVYRAERELLRTHGNESHRIAPMRGYQAA